jgi:hypothetical protein
MRGYQTYVDSQTVQKTKVIKSKGATYKVEEGELYRKQIG